MFISVIMCTRNRAEQLRRVLLTAVAMKKPDVEWEFLLIDNGSTDNTAEVVASVAGLLPIRHILEPEAGLSRGRGAGRVHLLDRRRRDDRPELAGGLCRSLPPLS